MNESKLIETKLFKGLSHSEMVELLHDAKVLTFTFKRNDLLWHEGDLIDGIGLVESGTLLCQRCRTNGKVRLVRLLAPGDLINVETGVSPKRTSPVSVVGASNGRYIWFGNKALLGNPDISKSLLNVVYSNLLAHLSDDAIRLMKNSDILTCRTVRERLVLYLDTLRETQGSIVKLGMSQKELAQHLFVDRTSLSEELNKMRREGLIEYTKTTFILRYPPGKHPDGRQLS